MEDLRQTLQQLCVPEHKVRETYFSETFRHVLKLDGEEGVWDVTHITIPFTPEKEDVLIQKFGLATASDLEGFYIALDKRIKAEQAMLKKAKCENRLADNFLSYRIRKAFPGEYDDDPAWAREYFLISEPVDHIWGSDFLREKGVITLSELVSLAVYLVCTLQELHQCGLDIHMGAFDLNTLYVAQNGDQKHLVNGSLLYGAMEEAAEQLKTVPGTAHQIVRAGGKQTLDTDLYALGSFLWALSDGRDWTVQPDFTDPPQHVPAPLTEILALCLDGGGEAVLRDVSARLLSLEQSLRDDPDVQRVKIPLVFPDLGGTAITAIPEGTVSDGYPGVGDSVAATAAAAEGDAAPDGAIVQPENNNAENLLLESMELVDLSIDGILDDGMDLESPDFTKAAKQEMSEIPQKAPLAPRQLKRQDVREDVEEKPLRYKVLIPIIVVAAVVAVTLCAAHFIRPAEGPDDTSASAIVDDQDANDSSNDPYFDGLTEEDVLNCWYDEDPDVLTDSAGGAGDINVAPPESTTTVLPRSGGATEKNEEAGETDGDSVYYVGNKPVKPSGSSKKPNNSAGRPSGSAGNTGNSGKKPNNKPSKPNNAPVEGKPGTMAPDWLGATTGQPPTQWIHPVLPPVQTGNPSASSSQDGVFSVYPMSVSLARGEYTKLVTTDRCILRSENTSVAKIEGGKITGVGEGDCVVVATSVDTGASRTVVVSVR